MTIHCPHCKFSMELKGVKPGRFHPRCTACRGKFLLVIPSDPNQPAQVAIENNPSAETLSPVVAMALGVDQPKPAQVIAPRNPAQAIASTQATLAPTPSPAPSSTPSPSQTPPSILTQSSIPVSSSTPAPSPTPSPSGASLAVSQIVEPVEPFNDTDPIHSGTALGGYQVIQKLGQGGMGAVYLARQVSLDRNVALKVLSPQLSNDPQFVARFMREAYAAAQLSHHNVVQIHDIGAEQEVHFFSMEFVEGQTLAKLVDEHGKVDIEQAVGFVLQAARGLKYAHDHGMIHRDIKPENLLLNDAGIVKVADLGLVKRAGTNETAITNVRADGSDARSQTRADQTQVNMSMGTPAYMSPEQAQDAAHVDQRADVYSLGCTLYDLLTGRPPFVGRTALEVITKHQREAVVPPEMVVKNVPRTLSSILMKMVAKKPEQRYQAMGEVIRALEDFLGVATAGPFQPKEEHVKVLEFGVERFNGSMWRSLRKLAVALFFLTCAALLVFVGFTRSSMLGKVQWTGAFIGLAVMTSLAYTITAGITKKTPLFLRLRQLVFGANFLDWITWVIVLFGLGAALVVFNQHVGWIIVSVIAVLLAAAFHFTIDLMLARDRATPIAQVEAMLKQMRLRGLEENSLRQFACKYAGPRWEEFYEALFGYDAKLQARQLWGRSERGQPRPKFGAWRDPIIRAIETRLGSRRELRERRLLAKVEAKSLRSKGINEELARKQAKKNAERLVSRAEKLRSTSLQRAAATVGPTLARGAGATASPGSVQITKDAALEGAIAQILQGDNGEGAVSQRDEDERVHEGWFKRRYGTPLDLLLGQMVRFILAVIVLATFTLWFKQNSGDQAAREALEVAARRREIQIPGQFSELKGQLVEAGKELKKGTESVAANTTNRPLHPFPESFATLNHWTEPFGGWNAGLAGVLLLLSSFFAGRLMALVVLLSAGVALFGHRIALPIIEFQPYAWMSAAAAVLLWIFGVMFFREREGY